NGPVVQPEPRFWAFYRICRPLPRKKLKNFWPLEEGVIPRASEGPRSISAMTLNARLGCDAAAHRAGLIRRNPANFQPSRGRRPFAPILRRAGRSQSLG